MKLTTLLFFVALFQVSAISYSQQTRLNLKFEKETLESVFSKIEANSEFSIFYKNDLIRNSKEVSGEFKNALIFEILDQVLQAENLTYSVKNKLIMIVPKEGIGVEINLQQQKSVSGKVTDTSGASLPGVSVVIKGTTTGTITDNNGNYSLSNVPDNAVLQFSFVGMKGQEVAVGGKTSLNVTLVEDAIGIDEVVAVGYGTQKRENITGSVATIKSEKLTVAPVASVSNLLVGQLPGLIGKQQTGMPGRDGAIMSIRGFGNALIIVDGIESELNNIDANEIESVTVLKDASAAIYGARAGNGVILVTTKRGNSGKPTFTLNSSLSFQSPTYWPKLNSSGQYAELSREAHRQAGLPEETQQFTKEEVDLFYAGTNPDYPNEDWWGRYSNKWAPEQQHNLSVRGGSDKIKFYGFMGYVDQNTFFKVTPGGLQRYNLRSNIDAKITDNLTAQFDLSSIFENTDYSLRVSQGGIWGEYWNTMPYYNAILPDPKKIAYGSVGGGGSLLTMTDQNLNGYAKTYRPITKGSLSLNYNFKKINGLSAKVFFNYNQNYSFYKEFSRLVGTWTYNYTNDSYTQKSTETVPKLIQVDSKNRTLNGQFIMNFDRVFSEVHHLSAMALYEVIDYKGDWMSASRTGYKTFSIDYLFAGGLANQTSNGSANEMGRQSVVGRLNYSYNSKYFLESTLRIDESAKFSEESRRGVFPSLSIGWRISEEGFVKDNLPKLENLKLRASIGQTGYDEVGNFQYLSGYQYGDRYMIGSSATQGLVTTGMANPFLTWETMTIYNGGLDFSINKRKLYGELDMFYRDRDGIPGQRVQSLPSTFGASLPTENLNNINTRGFELLLGNQGKWQDFNWDISANISWSRSKWGHYDEPVYEDPDQERQEKRTGQWTDRLFGYLSDGLFTSQEDIDALTFVYDEIQGNKSLQPGDIRFIDVNNDGILNWKDRVEIGKGSMPNWMAGLNLKLNYKNFDLSTLFQGGFGFTQQVNFKYEANYTEFIYKNRWTPENNYRDGIVPRIGAPMWGTSDYFNKKSDYIRLKSFALGYTLPNSFTKKAGLQNVRVYVSGLNAFTFSSITKYFVDPEAPFGAGGAYYPQMRTFTFGLNLSL